MTTQSPNNARYMTYWILLTVILPVMVISVAWFMAAHVYTISNPFAETFGSGDLLPVAALLLLGLWLEIFFEHGGTNFGRFVSISEGFFIFFGVSSLMLYGFIKSFGIHVLAEAPHSIQAASQSNSDEHLVMLGVLSWAFMVYAVIHALCTKLTIAYMKKSLEAK